MEGEGRKRKRNGRVPRVKAAAAEPAHSPPSSAEIKNVWSLTSIPPVHLHGVALS
jgi:hypothetical protein